MIAGIPLDDLVKIYPKMTESQINRKWAENFFTPDTDKVTTEIEDFRTRWENKKAKERESRGQ